MLTTPNMDPRKIEPHDLRRDIETYRDNWSRVSDADTLTNTVIRAAAACNPYTAALANMILNMDAPNLEEAP